MSKKIKVIQVVGVELQDSQNHRGEKIELVEVTLNTGDKVKIGSIKASDNGKWESLTVGPTPNRIMYHLTRTLAWTSLVSRKYS